MLEQTPLRKSNVAVSDDDEQGVGVGGTCLEEYDIPEGVQWIFVMVPLGKDDRGAG